MGVIFRKPYKAIRVLGKYGDDGKWLWSGVMGIDLFASVQPLKMSELEALPEGRRSYEALKIYTSTELRTAEQASVNTANNPDVFYFNNTYYEVTAKAGYKMTKLSHFKYYLTEFVEGEWFTLEKLNAFAKELGIIC